MPKAENLRHWPSREDNEPGKPTVYVASCGYESTEKREFVNSARHGLDAVTCTACRGKRKRKESVDG